MESSQKDAVNNYIVHIDTKGCNPFRLSYNPKASTKSTDAERIKELEQKKVELESIIEEKTISYNNEIAELKKNIEQKTALYYNQQISVERRFREEKTQLQKQLREKQDEINDLAVHLTVFKDDVEKYLSNNINLERLKNTIAFMSQRVVKINLPEDFKVMNAIENIWDVLRASREQQEKEEAQRSAMFNGYP